ncbi:hypothetical protein A2344_01290 [Candidatus Peregrinibacteria bacterium RIFOXYB12_FULL_41_12]|nr:MAG: hypothetical protein A2344_01290 [Candidatus Peregrinibacteria bacterium RIFOXYB12_FULL_41_12]OGJ48330.1 MAG: hypothetical protein A2244_02345 [Candidatus Peregrinibacteria bacterium RIFOXYA2_FULL_41_18]OGJ53588.1 MAG: hypothetical protein A2448_03925 [Candidatus Peregrinibacteria bacterium RIFOXYC2_FULL_41_22]OGJ54034.1 MAG: hypothetical protein A2336_00095 [Candidatus Peregrinibacteria bacterium RIFOXYB2_FULL_41_88]
MSTARKVLGNTAVQVAGRFVMAFMSIIIVKLITSYLGLEGYGKYSAIYEFLAFFGVAADLGLFTISVREMAKEDTQEAREHILSNIITMRSLLCIATMTVAIIAAYFVPQYKAIHLGIIIASAAVFLSTLQSAVASLLQFNLKMQYATIAQVAGKAASLAYIAYTIYYGFTEPSSAGFYNLIVAGVVGNIVLLGVTYFFARRYGRIFFGTDWNFIRKVLLKSVPYGIALVLNMIYFRVGSIMLLLMKGPTEVGIYAVPMRVLEILSLIPVFFMNSVLPVLTRHVYEKTERVKDILKYSFDFLFMAGVPLVAGTQVLAYGIVGAISTPEFLSRIDDGFYGSDSVIKFLMIAMMVAFINSLFIYSIIASSHQNRLLWLNGGCAIFNVVLNLFMIPWLGARGAAITSIATETLLLVLAYLVARKDMPFTFSFGTLWKTLFAGVLMAVVVWGMRDFSFEYLKNYNIVVLVPIGAVVYGGVLFGTKAVTKDILDGIRQKA